MMTDSLQCVNLACVFSSRICYYYDQETVIAVNEKGLQMKYFRLLELCIMAPFIL